MKKEELDKLKQALLESIVSAFSVIEVEPEKDTPLNEEIFRNLNKKTKEVDVKIPKKRGRPPKTVKVEGLDEYIEDILNFEAPLADENRKKNNYVTVAKRAGTSAEIKSTGNLQDFKKDPNRKIRFIDDLSIGDKIAPEKYPDRTERRPAAQLGKFKCDVCGKEFEGSYREFPQALQKFKDVSLGINNERPLLKCNDCACRPVGR